MSYSHTRSRRRRDPLDPIGTLSRVRLMLVALVAASAASGLPTGIGTEDTRAADKRDTHLSPDDISGPSQAGGIKDKGQQDPVSSSNARNVDSDIMLDVAGLAFKDESEADHIKSAWEAGRVETKVDPNSTLSRPLRNTYASLSAKGASKGKQGRRTGPPTTNPAGQSPFSSADIGAHGSNHYLNIGLFRPDYPFVPSGRRRFGKPDKEHQPLPAPVPVNGKVTGGVGNSVDGDDEDDLIHLSSGPPWSVPPWQSRRNVFKQGWTKSILDDDVRLSVPDDRRRPRSETAGKLTRDLLRKKWWRWKPGEGYVLSSHKDFDIYRKGPGIALAQLLPPREKAYVSPLPWIPNQSKREMAIYIPLIVIAIAIVAIVIEVRAHFRTLAKGKAAVDGRRRGSGPSQQHEPAFFVYVPPNADEATIASVLGRSYSSSAEPSSPDASRGLRTRQRTKARNLRELCREALDRGVQQVSLTSLRGPTSSTRKKAHGAVGDGRAAPLRATNKGNFRWTRIPSTVNETEDSPSIGGEEDNDALQDKEERESKARSVSSRRRRRKGGDGGDNRDDDDSGNDTFELLEKGGVNGSSSLSSSPTTNLNQSPPSFLNTSTNGRSRATNENLSSPSRLTSISIAPP